MNDTPDEKQPSGVQEPMDRRPTIMTLEEVAKYLRVHKSTVYRMAREGTIPATKVANQWRFKKGRIDEWLMQRGEDEA